MRRTTMINMIIKYHNSKKIANWIALYLLFAVFTINPVFSQDIYNLDNSKKYAEYLMISHQYKLASEEYERLVFLNPGSKEFKVKLLHSYRKSGNLGLAINRAYGLAGGNIYSLSRGLSVEYLSSLVLTDSLKKINLFLKKNNTLDIKDNAIFKCSSLLLDRKYKESKMLCVSQEEIPIELRLIANEALDRKFKSPFIAAGLSTIIPGLGKVYTKNYVDGIMSLVFVAGAAWQSYKGFKSKGEKSISGWVFGGISLGFYIGNIYGSAKAAKRYNNLKYNETNNEVYHFIEHYNF